MVFSTFRPKFSYKFLKNIFLSTYIHRLAGQLCASSIYTSASDEYTLHLYTHWGRASAPFSYIHIWFSQSKVDFWLPSVVRTQEAGCDKIRPSTIIRIFFWHICTLYLYTVLNEQKTTVHSNTASGFESVALSYIHMEGAAVQPLYLYTRPSNRHTTEWPRLPSYYIR